MNNNIISKEDIFKMIDGLLLEVKLFNQNIGKTPLKIDLVEISETEWRLTIEDSDDITAQSARTKKI